MVRPRVEEPVDLVHLVVADDLGRDGLVPEHRPLVHDRVDLVDLQELHGRLLVLLARGLHGLHQLRVGKLVKHPVLEVAQLLVAFATINEGFVLQEGREATAVEGHPEVLWLWADVLGVARAPVGVHDVLVEVGHPGVQLRQLGELKGLELVLLGQLLADLQGLLPHLAGVKLAQDVQVELLLEQAMRLAVLELLPPAGQRLVTPVQQFRVLHDGTPGLGIVVAPLMEAAQFLQVLHVELLAADLLVKVQEVDNARHLVLLAVAHGHRRPVFEQELHELHHHPDVLRPGVPDGAVLLAVRQHDALERVEEVLVAEAGLGHEQVQLGDQLVLELVEVGLGLVVPVGRPRAARLDLFEPRAEELALDHVEEDRDRGLAQVGLRDERHLQEVADHGGHEVDLVLAEVEPHLLDFQAHGLPHVAIRVGQLEPFVLGELFQLERGLLDKRHGALEEVIPCLELEVVGAGEVVPDGVSKLAQGLGDHVVLEHDHSVPVAWEDVVVDQVAEHPQDLHDEVGQVVPALGGAHVEGLDVLVVVLGRHLAQEADHVGHHGLDIVVPLPPPGHALDHRPQAGHHDFGDVASLVVVVAAVHRAQRVQDVAEGVGGLLEQGLAGARRLEELLDLLGHGGQEDGAAVGQLEQGTMH